MLGPGECVCVSYAGPASLGHAHLDRPLTSRHDSSSSLDSKNERCWWWWSV